MKINYTKNITMVLALLIAASCYTHSFAQIEYRYLDSSFGTALADINDSGHAVVGGGTYNFALDSLTPMDTDVVQLNSINNNGDLAGLMPIILSGQTVYQPAYKKNGVWHPIGLFPNATIDGGVSVFQISENGEYVVGQMSPDCCDYQTFLYNITADTLERIADPANEYGAGYCVNDAGIAGGWYDPQPVGTLRVPAIMTTGSFITSIPPGVLPTIDGQVSAINNSNLIVGDREGVPFMYDLISSTYTSFSVPAGYETATFTSVSENGIAVGYAQLFDFNGLTRDAIIYHPSLGSQPVFIKDVLAAHGITIPTADGKLGTAIAISPDGNYVCGWENGPFFFAYGWAVNFNDSLISDCYLTCPQDIQTVSLTGPKIINYSLPITCPDHPLATYVLVAGLDSGAAFPVGTTLVVHNLVDTNGTVLNTCSFSVTIDDHYCDPTVTFTTPEAITLVNFAGINNASSDTSTAVYEDFTSIVGNVYLDSTYTGIFKGYTGGNFIDYFSVFVDWNRDGTFDNTESYEMGSIENSTGLDTIQATGNLTVPSLALPGLTTMRVLKSYNSYAPTACAITTGYGQVEDYKLLVTDPLGIAEIPSGTLDYYPNPVSDVLTITNTKTINSISVVNLLGQEQIKRTLNNKTAQLKLTALPAGIYFVNVSFGREVKSFKVVKE